VNRPRAAQARDGQPFVVVASRFNEPITRKLVAGAVDTLLRHGVSRTNIKTVWVRGAFELPVTAAAVGDSLRPQAIIALGCLIKGQTPQYAAIGNAVAMGLMQVSVSKCIPLGFGVIVAESFSQARARAGGSMGHRGQEAALAAMDVARQVRQGFSA